MPTYHKDTVLPVGTYDVKIMTAEERKSKSGNDMIVLRLVIYWHSRAHTLRDHLVFTESSYWKVECFLHAMGDSKADGDEIRGRDYVNRTARIVVGVDYFQGYAQNKVQKWLPAEHSGADAPEPSTGTPEEGTI